MRVLMVTSQLPHGRQSLDMAPALRQIDSLRRAGAEVDIVEVTGLPKLKYLQAIPRLRRLARTADIIHGHYAFCGWLAKLRRRTPVVVSFMGDDLLGSPDDHGRIGRSSRLIIRTSRWLARRVDAVIVKSQQMADVVAPIRAYVVPNGVDMDAFQPCDRATARRELGWPVNQRFVLFPGNPANPRKGFPLAAAAIAEANRRQSAEPIELVPLRQVPPEQVPLYMNACDAMVMASFIEGSPNVIKEAMACNLPIVSVPVGDTEAMLSGVEGCRICHRDPVEMGQNVRELLASHSRSMGRAAIEARGLSLESVAQQLLTIYAKVLAA